MKYGGLKRDGDTEFSADDGESVTEVTVKGSSTQTIEIEAIEVQEVSSDNACKLGLGELLNADRLVAG